MAAFLSALLQLNSGPDTEKNLLKTEEFLEEAAAKGAKLAGLPENFPFLGPEKEKLERGKEIEERTKEFLHRTSKKYKISILAGGYPTPAPNGKVYNTASFYGKDGEEKFKYHKIHLFDTDPGDGIEYRESRSVEAGVEPPSVYEDSELGRISTVICYDLRFPELFRILGQEGSQIVFVPAAFTKLTGQAHWEVLLRARAIENQCFILAPAQTGLHGAGRETYGHSLAIDPWGEILADGGEGEKVVFAEVDPERISQVRKKIPAWNHRRL